VRQKNEIIDQIGIDILLEQGEWCDMKTVKPKDKIKVTHSNILIVLLTLFTNSWSTCDVLVMFSPNRVYQMISHPILDYFMRWVIFVAFSFDKSIKYIFANCFGCISSFVLMFPKKYHLWW